MALLKNHTRLAPLAQLVEHLTLNQGVQGSSPWWCTIQSTICTLIVGVNNDEGPPVPIPNTEVKLIGADNTRRATAREDRSMPTPKRLRTNRSLFFVLLQ